MTHVNSTTADELKSILHYEPLTGIFVWRVRTSNRIHVGDIAGSMNDRGYILIKVGGHNERAHRVSWLYMTGNWPAGEIDHKNRDRSDNRWLNLRLATPSQNKANRERAALGVRRTPSGKFTSRVKVERQEIHLGTFVTFEEAARTRAERLKEHFGEFARIGDV